MRLLTFAFMTLAATAVVIIGTTTTSHATTNPDIVDVAHRGASGSAPENTLAAVRVALRQHSSFIEVDVQRSADGELVIMHDTTLERTTNVEEVFPHRAPWNVGDFTLAELRQLDAGSWFAPEFTGEAVPTLREVVEVITRRAGLLLEVKSPALYPGIETDIDKELSSIPGYLPSAVASGRLVVQSFNHDSMRAYHDLAPQVPIGLLYRSRPSETQLVAASLWADQINPGYRVTDRELVEQVHELDMTISVYTLNTGRLMREYADMGVDGIISDYPAVLRDILHDRT